MVSYKTGSKFKKVPVLKFMGYDKIVVLLDGHPEVAIIDGETNVFRNVEDIYHISAPAGTVADLEVRPTIIKAIGIDGRSFNIGYYEKRGCSKEEIKEFEKIWHKSIRDYDEANRKYDKFITSFESPTLESGTSKDLVASNIRIE